MTKDSVRRSGRLSRDRVLRVALEVADGSGVSGLTIRSLAASLGVKPMAIYHHVANKEEILDGVVDLVFGEIDVPRVGGDWRTELDRRCRSMRGVLARHRWAIGLLESRRSPGPATLTHLDAMTGVFLESGFSFVDTSHGIAFVDAYVYGFALQEAMLPFESTAEVHDLAEDVLAALPTGAYPHFEAFARAHVLQPGYDFGAEFDVGLTMVLDAVARLPTAPRHRRRPPS